MVAQIGDLRAAGVSGAKCKTLFGLCQRLNGNPDFTESTMKSLSHPERASRLTQLWGVGPWTVEMSSIFYFRDPDIWPTSDGAICSGVQRILNRSDLNSDQVAKFGKPFAPFRSYLALHIWKALDDKRL